MCIPIRQIKRGWDHQRVFLLPPSSVFFLVVLTVFLGRSDDFHRRVNCSTVSPEAINIVRQIKSSMIRYID